MNKLTKIGVLGLGLLALTTALFVNAGVGGDTKQVSLTLSGSNNTCVTDNFNLGTQTMTNSATTFAPVSNDLTCEFLSNGASKVNLALEDLSAGSSLTIDKSNFSFSVTAGTISGKISAGTASSNTFAEGRTIYNKEANKLGSWTTSLTISGTVPAFTAAGTYTGNLHVTIQAN